MPACLILWFMYMYISNMCTDVLPICLPVSYDGSCTCISQICVLTYYQYACLSHMMVRVHVYLKYVYWHTTNMPACLIWWFMYMYISNMCTDVLPICLTVSYDGSCTCISQICVLTYYQYACLSHMMVHVHVYLKYVYWHTTNMPNCLIWWFMYMYISNMCTDILPICLTVSYDGSCTWISLKKLSTREAYVISVISSTVMIHDVLVFKKYIFNIFYSISQ